jgi:segregation and condensation protein A
MDPVRSGFGRIVKEPVRLADKLIYITDYAKTKKKFTFKELLVRQESRQGLVVAFLAILELMKTGAIKAVQETTFGDIDMEWEEGGAEITKEDLEQYD